MTTAIAYAAPSAGAPLARTTIERREVGPRDVALDIAYAGVCHSDIHTVRDEWGAANYPLVPEDFETDELPRPVRELRSRCFGITTSPNRLTQVRNERRPNSKYASFEQCSYELRRAESMFRSHRIPVIDSSATSVEEMSTVILQLLKTAR